MKSKGAIRFIEIKGHTPKWRCSLLIITKGSGVAHLVSQGWGNTKYQALDQAMAEAHDFFQLSKAAGEKLLKRLVPKSARTGDEDDPWYYR